MAGFSLMAEEAFYDSPDEIELRSNTNKKFKLVLYTFCDSIKNVCIKIDRINFVSV